MKFILQALLQASIGAILLTSPLQAQLDYGDAPDPSYPTLQINAGASHQLSPLFLGSQIDADSDGQPGTFANGDDQSSTYDDEEGVQFSSWLIPGQQATVVVNASGQGMLDGWIDFQANGNWSDPGDQIFLSQLVVAGPNIINFSVPANAGSGIYSYARFRLSTAGGLGVTGMALDGEVEDYRLFIGLPNPGDAIIDLDPGLSSTQNEISMVLLPGSHTLIAAYNDHPDPISPGIGLSISTDKAQSWTSQQMPMPLNSIAGVPMVDAFDPTVAVDDSGHIFVAHIATDFNWTSGPVSGLYLHKSTDGGLSWKSPLAVSLDSGATAAVDSNFRFNDRCQLRIDRHPASPHYGNIYLAWLKDRGWNITPPLSDVYVAVSTDGGQSFSQALQVNHPSHKLANLPIPEVALNGDLYLLWVDYNVATGGTGVLMLNRSTDGGQSWGSDQIIDSIPLPPLNLNAGTDARARGAAILRTDPADSNQLYLVYAADPDGQGADEANIYFKRSGDGGSSWSDSLRLNDDNGSSDQVLPWMEITPGGIINIAWYDRRNDSTDLQWDVYRSYSTDQGQSFAPNLKVNNNSFLTPLTLSGPWFGEYLALVVDDSAGYIGFSSSIIDPAGDVLASSFAQPPAANASCLLTCISDSSWQKSTVITPSDRQGVWKGVKGQLPDSSTYTLAAAEGNPYSYPSIEAVDSAKILVTGPNISYFRKSFKLSRLSQLNMRLRLTVDDQVEIYLNGHRLAAIESFGKQNYKLPQHDLVFKGSYLSKNGFMGGDAFDFVSSLPLDSILRSGKNEIVVAVRNLGKTSDKGGFSLRLEIDSCTTETPPAPACVATIKADQHWLKSSLITSSNLFSNFSGVGSMLPADSTFSETVNLGQPYGYTSIASVGDASVISTGAHISYFRRFFNLKKADSVNVRLRMTVDDQAEIYINGRRFALISSFGSQNFQLPAHDAFYVADTLHSNGYSSGDSYNWLYNGHLDSVLAAGSNQVTLAIRNLGKSSDKGGFSFLMELDTCGDKLLPKSSLYPDGRAEQTGPVMESIFPNPTHTSVTLQCHTQLPSILKLSFYDLRGQEVLRFKQSLSRAGQHRCEYSLGHLPAGVYLLKWQLSDDQGNTVSKQQKLLKI